MEETRQQLVYRVVYAVCQEYDLGVTAYFRICDATERAVREALALPHSPASDSRPEGTRKDEQSEEEG